MKNKTLAILKENQKKIISGEYISGKIGITRAGVWKHIETFKNEGYGIESITGRGYRFISSPDILLEEEISKYLNTGFIGQNIKHFDTVNSTNKEIKNCAYDLNEGMVVVAEEQTLGKGRLDREWISPKFKGIWMSILLKPELEPAKLSKLTQIGAVAVFKSLEKLGIKSEIKWPNDILINKKKVAGILTEMSAELNMVNYVVMGIGINVNLDKKDFPSDLKPKATSIKIEENKIINRKILAANILNEFERYYIDFKRNGDISKVVKILNCNSALIGKEVKVINREKIRIGKAIGIDGNGELIVEFKEGIENIYSGEISIRGKSGYI